MQRVVLIFICGLLIGAFTGAVNLGPNQFEGRIVGGEDTTIVALPYQVSLLLRSGSHFCGGSLISEKIVVTAAHCLQGIKASSIWVRFYNEGSLQVAVESLIYHENYNSNTMQYDVGLLKLAESVSESTEIRFIELAQETPATGTSALATVRCSSVLQSAIAYIVDWQDCASDTSIYGDIISDTMVCAYEKTQVSCQNDSGGPLVANNQLVGIDSWGYGSTSNLPGVYTDVATLRDWILNNAKTL